MSSKLSAEEKLGVLSNTFSQLDIAVFGWNESGSFDPLCKPPRWFDKLYMEKMRTQVVEQSEFFLGTHFPFIENFLYDAEQVWAETENNQLRSGIWTEDLNDGSELYLEAIALRTDDHPLLIIVNETTNFDIRHKVFQNARNLALKNEKLERSVQDHQRSLQKQLEKICKTHSAIDQIPDEINQESSAVLICKEDGNIEIYNKALVDIYALNEDTLHRQSLLEKWTQEAEGLYPEIHRVLRSGNHWEGEFESYDSNDIKKWIRMVIAPIKNSEQQIDHFVCIANDISNVRLNIAEIEKLTQIDVTTQLPNRRHFWSFLRQQIDKQQAEPSNLALFYIDLDHFRQVNEDLGPKQADFLLNAVATRIKRCLKQQDYVSHLGGDEFAVIVSGFTDQHALAMIAQRILDNICRDVSFHDFTLNTSASIGIAIFPQHGLKARALVKSADYAMYHAKEMGRNQFKFSSPYSRGRIKQKLHIEQGLKQALANDEFELLYQPQIAIGAQTEHRLEALIRWQHPQKGRVTPADFISIAEESGLIIELGNWVLNDACQQVARFNQIGLHPIISINVSPKQFKFSNLSQSIADAIERHQIDPTHLELEVTESIFVEELDQVVAQLQTIRNLGVSISLDDFGTGYSSLSYLKSLPIDILKIDRSFVQELPENKQSATIVETIINMAHQLSIRVIAEGVENQAQFEYLEAKGCDFVQGFLFYAPLESEKIFQLYQSFQSQPS